MRRLSWMMASVPTALALATLIVAACGSGGSGGDERKSCKQATDCGEGGRLYFVCATDTQLCYTRYEYCDSDSECLGSCKEHLCTNGKKPVTTDGDTDAESEADTCSDGWACCDDSDCGKGTRCDASTHTCVADDSSCLYTCCDDSDCAGYADLHVCKKHHCVPPTDPCPTACCEDSDCKGAEGETWTCDDKGTCQKHTITCTPGTTTCCSSVPTDSQCAALGSLLVEAKRVCNATGDAYMIVSCPEFQSCLDNGNGTFTCFPNGRCNVDSDCGAGVACQSGQCQTSSRR